MRTTKAQLEAQVKMLRWNNETLLDKIQCLQRDNEHLEKRLKDVTSFASRLGELPQAVHGATEALAHMLTDARQMYISSSRRDYDPCNPRG